MQPWHIVLLALSAMIDGKRDKAIDYLLMENQVLREKLGKGRILLNDDQRRRLAVKGKVLGRGALHEIATIVTPENVNVGISPGGKPEIRGFNYFFQVPEVGAVNAF